MTTPPESVVVGIDGSSDSDMGLMWAATEAERRRAPLHLIHAFVPYHAEIPLTTAELEQLNAAARRLVSQARGDAQQLTDVPITGEVVEMAPGAALVNASRRARLVVLGARGHSAVSGLLVGSVSQQVATHAHCPVAVVRKPADPHARRIVVGVDASAGSDRAMSYAMRIADRDRIPVTALYGWHDHDVHTTGTGSPAWSRTVERIAEGERLLDKARETWTSTYPDVTVTCEAIPVAPTRALTDASVVVVGARGHGGSASSPLGSVGRAVLHHARCPVVVAR